MADEGQLGMLSRALRASLVGTWAWDGTSGRVVWDEQVERLFGLPPSSFVGTVDGWFALLHPDDRQGSMVAWQDAIATKTTFRFEHRCVWPDDTVHWLEVRGEIARTEGGDAIDAVGVIANIDVRRGREDERVRLLAVERAERDRVEYLARAGQTLSASLDLDELIEGITAAAVPGLADWCRLVLMLDGANGALTTAVAHSDPAMVTWAKKLDIQIGPNDLALGVGRVMQQGVAELYEDISAEMIDAAITDPDRREAFKRLGVKSVMLVALRSPLGTLGVLQLIRTAGSVPYGDADLAIAKELASIIGAALNNVQLYRRQQSASHALDVLQRLTGRLSVAVTVDDVVNEVVQHGTAGLGADGGVVYLLDDSGRLHIAAHAGYNDELDRWSTISLDMSAPVTDALRTGVPVVLSNRRAIEDRYPQMLRSAETEVALLAIPLQLRRVMRGALVFSFRKEHRVNDDEMSMLETLAGRCAGSIERARLYEHQREISITLQRRMLPVLPPLPPWLVAGARYEPATGGEVGGDWFQLLVFDDRRCAAVLGDAVGRGIVAAAAMGQLRGVITGASTVDPEPARVIAATDSFASLGADTQAASMFYALIDHAADELRYSNAGHPPGVLVRADGSATLLEGGRGTLLGTWLLPAVPAVATIDFVVGDTLILYSDGLIERRGEPIDVGIERLIAALKTAPQQTPEEICDALLQSLVGDRMIHDDIAVLAVRRQ